MKGRHLRRRFSLQPSFMKDDSSDDKHKRDKVHRNAETDDAVSSNHVRHKIVCMGSAKVGKTSIITQFLYNKFSTKYKRTVEEMHQGTFSISGVSLTLDILDTSGSFEFPAMRALSISSADAFILVYDITDSTTFDEVKLIRDLILETKGPSSPVPIVIVGNKLDLVYVNCEAREVDCDTTEKMVTNRWENGFVESSAKDNENITKIFKELLVQAKIKYNLSPALQRRRRQSLPPNQIGCGSGGGGSANTPTHTVPISSTSANATNTTPSHVPSQMQLEHLQKIQERNLGGKRNSCMIS